MKRKRIKKIENSEKIAAGEVIERPANVIKELVENSIDAGASEIKIVVKKAGKSLIQVIDNGIGIPPEEIELAFQRHTSSKIRSIEDLNNLTTLGFRGEALASMTAISKIEITSKTEDNERGVYLSIEGGKITERKEIICPIGTDIKVKHIFYNIPARKKFLRTDSTELGHITDIIQRYCLAYSEIHFIYLHNQLNILTCPSNDLKTTIFHIYGKKAARNMEYVDYSDENENFRVYGLLGHPENSKKNRKQASLFLNHRYIISDLLFKAIQEAYKKVLMRGGYPFFVLFLELNPKIIDFNVHPKKLEVRFENDDIIYNKFFHIIDKFIEEKFIKQETKHLSTKISQYVKNDELTSKKTDISEEKNLKINEKAIDKATVINGLSHMDNRVQLNLNESASPVKGPLPKIKESLLREKYIIAKNFPKLRLISKTGQLSNKIYVVLEGYDEENNPGFFLLDQHAASERINKERFLINYEKQKCNRQKLINPLKIEVSPSEKYFLRENLQEIAKLGFTFEHFGGNTFLLREIPTIINKLPSIEVIHELINDMTDITKEERFQNCKEEIINYLACHRSIRGGDELTLKDIRSLLIELSNCKDPFHCAHGRPTLKFISFKEVDKLFKRTG
ncbi:MAG: DNA mismatch repair endonuclease MutL [Candidatus Lokiarchaeota archaeon]|nr:DNA mismatch repair endonuclease MutL [Candidatus Lokiarchaeota archaeon]MBD3342474.1 DNA mismatch repair endonuclease MutL [Candidatus Lokiarchaeota archaeon]